MSTGDGTHKVMVPQPLSNDSKCPTHAMVLYGDALMFLYLDRRSGVVSTQQSVA